ncbi:MAG: hypothetical protein GY702_10985 [Desulfobulbaceae bacterium]|nr:hypothetical protein [Desulfobulbaceae bacterium]
MADKSSRLSFDPLPTGLTHRKNIVFEKEDDGIIRPLDEVMANHIQRALDLIDKEE